MIRLLLVCLIPIAFINYFIFYTKLSAIISLVILAVGIIIDLLTIPREEKKKRIFFYFIVLIILFIIFISTK